jgi:hypothetical protein
MRWTWKLLKRLILFRAPRTGDYTLEDWPGRVSERYRGYRHLSPGFTSVLWAANLGVSAF